MSLTDLHIYAKQEGLRDTEWEREGFGWGNNRALVLLKSHDLIHWKRANGGYDYEPLWCDPEEGACEAPTLWKRKGEDKYVLMYDVFSARPNNMGFSETSDFVNYENLGHFNHGKMKTVNFTSPKHGAVVMITKKELKRLMRHWKFNLN